MRLALFVLAVALAVPTTSRAQLDHLKCYRIKDHLAKVPAYSATLTPGNPSFTAETGCLVKVPAKMLCIDVTKSNVTPAPPGAAPGAQAGTFLCYKLKCRGATPSLMLTDQFGTRQVDVGVAKLLCAPVTAPTTTTTTSTTVPMCGQLGASCVVTADCCQNFMTLHCSFGICTCSSIGMPCTTNGECCYNNCAAGSCMP